MVKHMIIWKIKDECENKEFVKEKVKADARDFEAWLKGRGYKNGSAGMSPKILATLRRQYKRGE